MKNSKSLNRLSLSGICAFFLLGLTLLFNTSAKADGPVAAGRPKTYVLVHGAWQGAYSWKQVKAELEKKGNKVVLVELPGNGEDQTDPGKITMDTYSAKVIEAVSAQHGKVVLVGHSMGGMVISATAEAVPEKIERLIYVAAFVPKNGESLGSLGGGDQQSELGKFLKPEGASLDISDHSQIARLMCDDGTDAVKQELTAKYRPAPIIPFSNPVALTSKNFGGVVKSYIRTTKDLAIGINLQNQMIKDAAISDVHDIVSSHSPHLSMPKELSGMLIAISK